jgi:hypothetical protein
MRKREPESTRLEQQLEEEGEEMSFVGARQQPSVKPWEKSYSRETVQPVSISCRGSRLVFFAW